MLLKECFDSFSWLPTMERDPLTVEESSFCDISERNPWHKTQMVPEFSVRHVGFEVLS